MCASGGLRDDHWTLVGVGDDGGILESETVSTVEYVAMLVFDATILCGTAWLIGWHSWSAWWMVLAILIISASRKPES